MELGRRRGADGRSLDLIAALRRAGAGVRILGTSALALAYLAAGRVDLVVIVNPGPWDVAAGWALCESAGLEVDLRGGALTDPVLDEVVAGPPGLLREFRGLLAG